MDIKQLIIECDNHGIDIRPLLPKKHIFEFKAIACIQRGLGPEYVNLEPIITTTINEAKKIAEEQATNYIKKKPGFEKATVEVRVRPNE